MQSIMRRLLGIGVLTLALGAVACSGPILLQGDRAGLSDAIADLQRRVVDAPQDVTSLRDLGALYVMVHRPGDSVAELAEGEALLSRANELLPGDAKTLLYLGLAREALGQPDSALVAYQQYETVYTAPPGTMRSYRRLLQRRYLDLQRTQAQAQVRALVANEATLAVDSLASTTVGVFALDYQGSSSRYAALGRGLAELITIDLAKVAGITVVERVRLQALVDEIQLGQTGAIDVATAPRAGRLLQAGTVVGGTYDVVDNYALQVNVATFDVRANQAGSSSNEDGVLNDLFRLQKQIVFQVLEQDLGLTLTAEERAAIEFIPTQNFEAFLAFSQGLVQEDIGQWRAAAASFQQAAQLDPNFSMATEHVTTASEISSAGSTSGEILTEAVSFENYAQLSMPSDAMLDLRLGNMGTNLGASFIPSEDNRDALEEAVGAGSEPVPPSPVALPDPPPPPPPSGGN